MFNAHDPIGGRHESQADIGISTEHHFPHAAAADDMDGNHHVRKVGVKIGYDARQKISRIASATAIVILPLASP